jgi:hypothetical protein
MWSDMVYVFLVCIYGAITHSLPHLMLSCMARGDSFNIVGTAAQSPRYIWPCAYLSAREL